MKRTGIAAFTDLRTPSADGVRDATTVRPSASANFFIDSTDRSSGSSTNFTITKGQSLFNGYFNRLAVAEVVLNWGVPNIAAYWGNDVITIRNATTTVGFQVNLQDSFYRTVDLMTTIVDEVNALALGLGDPLELELSFTAGELTITSVGVGTDPFIIEAGTLAEQLFFPNQLDILAGQTAYAITAPLILGTKYIDIVSQQLTYNQELKDSTTATYPRDVLYRWYFTYDNVPVAYDYITTEINAGQVGPPFIPPTYAQVLTDIPIIEGYTAFVSRRTPPTTKQIRWSPEQPIGQVQFQIYDDKGKLLDLSTNAFPEGARCEFQMSMLLSED